jgi:hypothetical protein
LRSKKILLLNADNLVLQSYLSLQQFLLQITRVAGKVVQEFGDINIRISEDITSLEQIIIPVKSIFSKILNNKINIRLFPKHDQELLIPYQAYLVTQPLANWTNNSFFINIAYRFFDAPLGQQISFFAFIRSLLLEYNFCQTDLINNLCVPRSDIFRGFLKFQSSSTIT